MREQQSYTFREQVLAACEWLAGVVVVVILVLAVAVLLYVVNVDDADAHIATAVDTYIVKGGVSLRRYLLTTVPSMMAGDNMLIAIVATVLCGVMALGFRLLPD